MDPVEEIKDRIAIDELVGRYVELKRSGASFKGLCPFHQEKTPSFYVTPSRGTFHCFGCDRGGDAFTFLMEIERIPFREALERLADQAGVKLAERDEAKPSLKKQLYEVNAAAAKYFHEHLASPQGERARAYLSDRRFDAESTAMFDLGYAPEGRDVLVRHLRSAGQDDRVILAAGLALEDEIGGSLRDRFRGRLMFPIRDATGRIAGFGGRILGDAQPKYLNSPQTEVFDKSSVLYGIHRAAEPIRKLGRSVLVEGYLDAVRAHRAGFDWTVASLGTAITVPQLTALSRLSDTVIIALDPDPAGQAAAARAALIALAEVSKARTRSGTSSALFDLRVARLPEDAGDPDELIRDQPDRWTAVIEASVPAFEFFFRQTMDALDRNAEGWRQQAIDRLLPHIQQFSHSAGWQAEWIERLSRETGVDPRALLRTMGGERPAGRRATPAPNNGQTLQAVVEGTTSRALASDESLRFEEALIAYLLKVIVVPTPARDALAGVRVERPEHRAILEALLDWADTGGYDYEMLRESIPESARPVADELQARTDVQLPDEGRISVGVAFHLARLRQARVRAQLSRTSQLLQDMDGEGRREAVAALGRLNSEQREVDGLLDRLSKEVLQSSTGNR